MKLYEVGYLTYIKVLPNISRSFKKGTQLTIFDEISRIEEENNDSVIVPVASPQIKHGEFLFFYHIDGMYGKCKKVNTTTFLNTEDCYISANTEVDIVDPVSFIPFEILRKIIGRSGYGKSGKDEFRYSALCDMSDEWVKNAIAYVGENSSYVNAYKIELQYRKLHRISILD
jgi:hypothetical protein